MSTRKIQGTNVCRAVLGHIPSLDAPREERQFGRSINHLRPSSGFDKASKKSWFEAVLRRVDPANVHRTLHTSLIRSVDIVSTHNLLAHSTPSLAKNMLRKFSEARFTSLPENDLLATVMHRSVHRSQHESADQCFFFSRNIG